MTKPGELQNKKTIYELAKEFPNKTYSELEKYRDADRHEEAQQIITQQENEELKDNQIKESWKDKYDLEHRLRQEAETETILIKGIGMNSPEMKAAKQKIEELHKELDRVKEAQDALANALEVNESHQKLNGKLQERITELEEENEKLNVHFEKQITGARKAGM